MVDGNDTGPLEYEAEKLCELAERSPENVPLATLPVLLHVAATVDRLVELTAKTNDLLNALIAPQKDLTEKGLKKKVMIVPANADTALRARVGRVARSYGMTMDQWVSRHGMRDKKLPRGVDAWLPTEEGLKSAGLPARTRFLRWVDTLEYGEVVGVDRAIAVFADFDHDCSPRRPTAQTLRKWLKEHPEMGRVPGYRPARFIKRLD